MKILINQFELKKWREKIRGTLGFVPTMGALHSGHASLLKKSLNQCDRTLASIFVNPTQFSAGEDFSPYPRSEKSDFELLESLGVDAVYCPKSVKDLYPAEPSTLVQPPQELTSILCGRFRPGHFQGVATIVLKLFQLTQPTRAYFGEKDYQQLQVVKGLVRDFFLDIKIVGCPTLREKSGLALSSRNRYLETADQRAALLYEVFVHGEISDCSERALAVNGIRD